MSSSGRKDLASFLGSEFLNENTCHPCYIEGKELEAVGFCTNCQEHLCEECYAYHTIPTMTKSHVLIQRKQSLKTSLKNTLKKSFSFKTRLPDKCPEHLDKTIKYFCPPHDYLGCSVCMTLNHRHCEGMEYIPDAAKEINSSDEYSDFENKLKQIVEDSEETVEDIKKRSAVAENYNIDALEAVASYKKDIIDVLDHLENTIVKKLQQIKEEEMHELNDASKKCKDTIKEALLISQHLKVMKHEKQNCSMYITLKKSKAKLKQLEDEIQNAQTESQNVKKAKHYTFKPTTEVIEHLKSFETLGKLIIQDTSPACLTDINIRSESDTTDCWISGMTVLPNNKLVLADRNNRKVKLLDTVETSICSEIQLESRPWDVAKVSDTQVVVSLPNRKRLVFMNIDPDLKIDHVLVMKEPCYGVTYGYDSLIVTCAAAGQHKVQVLDLEGKVLNTFVKNGIGSQIFHTPCYVALSANQKRIYVSNSGNNNLICLTLDGSVVASFTDNDLKFLRQSVVDTQGMVYVCDASGNLYQITADCKKVSQLFTESDKNILPFSISFDKTSQKLFIGMENKDIVKVIQVKHDSM